MRVVILSGGAGTRLWPLSTPARPKPLLRVLAKPDGGKESMLERVCRQLAAAGIPRDHISIVSGREQADEIRLQAGPAADLIGEPQRRNTFPAAALAAAYLYEKKQVPADEPVIVIPSDVYAEDGYFDTLTRMAQLCLEDAAPLILMGIRPDRPSGEFGYIVPEQPSGGAGNSVPAGEKASGPVSGRPLKVSRFVEKPSAAEAAELISRGALWNAGVFAFRLGWMLGILSEHTARTSFEALTDHYDRLENISFDRAVVEKTSDIAAVPYEGMWKDLGTWESLSSVMGGSLAGLVDASASCDDLVIINELPVPIKVEGISDVIICASPEGILIKKKSSDASEAD